MDDIKALLRKRKVGPKTDGKPGSAWAHSEAHALADEVSKKFNEPKKFGMFLGVILRVGAKRARTIFAEVDQGSARSKGRLFVWLCKKKE